MSTNDEIRNYLADQYSVDVDCVKNGNEATEEEAGLYYGEDFSWLVYGKMPNTDQVGWFFAGHDDDIKRDMHNYANRPQ